MSAAVMDAAPAVQGPDPVPVEGKTVKALTLLHLKRTYDMFNGNHGEPAPLDEQGWERAGFGLFCLRRSAVCTPQPSMEMGCL